MDDLTKQLGQRIKDLREQRSWSQREFSEIICVNKTYLGDIELGKRNPTIKSLQKIASGFGMSVGELLSGL